MRYLEDGSWLYSTSEDMPKDVPGFYQDSSNPRHWIPDLESCIYRTKFSVLQPCGRLKYGFHCNHLKKEVYPMECSECEIRLEK